MKKLEMLGLYIPEILLPADSIPISSWAVIACDQYTQDREYWKKAADAAGTNPSTLQLILPEVYLNDEDKTLRIKAVHQTMQAYRDAQLFKPPVTGFIYIERTTAYGRIRKGLVAAVDLETYEWKPFSKALIRATEATIPERIPPRMEIRRGAALELPHIMLLVNDPEHRFVEAAGTAVKEAGIKPVYDGDLMLDSGHVTGWPVQKKLLDNTVSALDYIANNNTEPDRTVFLLAVGDGNQSLATEKAVWDEYKMSRIQSGVSETELKNSPLRYALVEIVNIYDEGLTFEPIHRVLFHVDSGQLITYCQEQLGGIIEDCAGENELQEAVHAGGGTFGFVYCDGNSVRYQCLKTPVTALAVSKLQPVLDVFIKAAEMRAAYLQKDSPEIDYIHGSEAVFRLGKQPGTVADLLTPVAKDCFISTIAENGPLPRKSFSMGEASEKRFYLEARSIAVTN